MLRKHWFRRKTYGWGWTPVTWQGWLVLLVYAAGNIFMFRMVDLRSHSGSDTLIGFAPLFLLSTAVLCVICYFTGERPKWQWGRSKGE